MPLARHLAELSRRGVDGPENEGCWGVNPPYWSGWCKLLEVSMVSMLHQPSSRLLQAGVKNCDGGSSSWSVYEASSCACMLEPLQHSIQPLPEPSDAREASLGPSSLPCQLEEWICSVGCNLRRSGTELEIANGLRSSVKQLERGRRRVRSWQHEVCSKTCGPESEPHRAK